MERTKDVKHLMDKLKLTEEDALALIEFDKAVPAKPEPKTKTASTTVKKATPKSTAKNSTAKSGDTKSKLISEVQIAIENSNLAFDIQNLKSNSVSFKDADGKYYTIAITAHKSAPAGFQD